MKLTDKELVSKYAQDILVYGFDDSMRGKNGIRARIKKLGDELVKRDLLDEEVAKFIERS